MRGKGVPKSDFFCFFFALLGFLKWFLKLVSTFYDFWIQIWILIFWGVGFFWVPFGILLGPREDLLSGLRCQKPLKTNAFLKVFANAGFWFFEACDGSFGLFLALFGCSDPKMGSKMTSNIFRKSC